MKALRRTLVALCVSTLPTSWATAQSEPDPQYLDLVTVTGIRPASGDMTFIPAIYETGGLPPDEFNSQAALRAWTQTVQVYHIITDVRCMGSGDRKMTTSQSDVTGRWLAASDVYNHIRIASPVLQSMFIGAAINPLTGLKVNAFTVVYADGGTEKWILSPGPYFSAGVIDDPLNRSLKPPANPGVIVPSPTGCAVH